MLKLEWEEACRKVPERLEHGGPPPPGVFSEVFILKGFKSCVLEVFIPEGLRTCFSEVRIVKDLVAGDG